MNGSISRAVSASRMARMSSHGRMKPLTAALTSGSSTAKTDGFPSCAAMAKRPSNIPCIATARIQATSRLDARSRKPVSTRKTRIAFTNWFISSSLDQRQSQTGQHDGGDQQLRDAQQSQTRHRRFDDPGYYCQTEHPGNRKAAVEQRIA